MNNQPNPTSPLVSLADEHLESATGGATTYTIAPRVAVANDAFAVRPINTAASATLQLNAVRLNSAALYAFSARRC